MKDDPKNKNFKRKFEGGKKIEGALDRARTDDLRLIRATRYQLRYESSLLRW